MPTPEPGGSGAGGGTGGPGGGTGGGTVLGGRYRLEAVAGRGGMAEVWRARDTVLDRVVAVKWFTPGAGDVAAPARQQAEMRLLAGFNHPGLVTVYDAGVQPTPMGDRPFVVMEFVDGPTLAARLARSPLPPAAVGAIGSTIADALAYVHARGVVHRDIKPGNILLEGGDDAGPTTVKLADFGIARLVDDARVTKTGMTVGTASYLSPEQVRGEEITPKSDVYSLALVLLEAFTGSVEFPGSPVEAAVARLNRDPVIPGRLGPVWGPLLASMTARDPALRPTSREVADRLSGAPGATGHDSATTSYIPAAAGLGAAAGAAAYVPPTGGVPRPVVARAAGMPPVRPLVDDDPVVAEHPPRPLWPWIVGVLLLLVIGAGVAFALNLGGDDTPTTGISTTPPAVTSAPSTPSTAPTTPSTEASTPEDTPTPATTPPQDSATPTTPDPTPPSTPSTPSTSPSSASASPSTSPATSASSSSGTGGGNLGGVVPPTPTR